jgi:hypothetical protein
MALRFSSDNLLRFNYFGLNIKRLVLAVNLHVERMSYSVRGEMNASEEGI